MANRRSDILERAREIMSAYMDEQVMTWIHMLPDGDTGESLDAQWEVRKRLVQVRDQLIAEFQCSVSTANSQIGHVVSERNKKHVRRGVDGQLYLTK